VAETTAIQWTDSTFNPWIGCAKVSPGCDHCYAEVSAPARALDIAWGPHAPRRRTSTSNWHQPRRWNGSHEAFYAQHGRRRRVFCASLADVFDNSVDLAWRADLWALVRDTPHLDWLVLTKRIGNVSAMLPADWGCGYGNVWLGISVVSQDEADRDIPKLLCLPAAVRWLSLEPLLGSVSLQSATGPFGETLDWAVVGGESGPHARPMKAEWVHDLRAQCGTLAIAFFFKQWGGHEKGKGGCLLGAREVKAWPSLPCPVY